MRGPTPKPADERIRRNTDGGTTSTSVMLPAVSPSLPAWVDTAVEVKVRGAMVVVPKPPAGLLQRSLEAWVTFWSIPETSMLRPHHLPALERLVRLYDEEERMRRQVEKKHTVMLPVGGRDEWGDPVYEEHTLPGHLTLGSQGQLVEHPSSKMLDRKRSEIRQLEDRFAASPLAEFRVGWQRAAMLNEESKASEAAELAAAAAAIAEAHQAVLVQTTVRDEPPPTKKATTRRKPTKRTGSKKKKATAGGAKTRRRGGS